MTTGSVLETLDLGRRDRRLFRFGLGLSEVASADRVQGGLYRIVEAGTPEYPVAQGFEGSKANASHPEHSR